MAYSVPERLGKNVSVPSGAQLHSLGNEASMRGEHLCPLEPQGYPGIWAMDMAQTLQTIRDAWVRQGQGPGMGPQG